MYLTIIVAIALGYYIYKLEKRVRSIEKARGPGEKEEFRVNTYFAVSKHKKLGELTGIKSAIEGKDYLNWTEGEKTRWGKEFGQKVRKQSTVNFTYIPNLNAYFVANSEGDQHIVLRKGYMENFLYSAIVVGDENTVNKPYIELSIYERFKQDKTGKPAWMLTPCLIFNNGEEDEREEVLCEFPLFTKNSFEGISEEAKKMGFEVKMNEDVIEPKYEEGFAITELKMKKNGVEIQYFYIYK